MSNRLLVSLMTAFLLTGCASSGTKVEPSKIASFKTGVTTYAEVVRNLGTPSTVTDSSDGTRTVAYTYVEARTKAATFIPIVGIFAGGMDMDTTNVEFQFGRDGILQSYKTSNGQMETSLTGSSERSTTPSR